MRRCRGSAGSAIVEFALVSVLLVLLLFAVLQVAAVLYVKSMAASAASDGARYGANAGIDPAAAPLRAEDLMRSAVGSRTAAAIPCTGGAAADPTTGLATVRVDCTGRIRSLLVPVGAFVRVSVHAESLKERQ